MSTTDERIAGALRDLAARADLVPLAADDLWRAGQRRRRRGVLVTSAAAAGAAAVAVVLALTVAGRGTGPAGQGGPHRTTGPAAAVALSTPIVFEQVARTSMPPCAAGVHAMPGTGGAAATCLRLTGTRMTITRVESAHVQRNPLGEYELVMRLAPADARHFATLTRELAGQRSPLDRLAIVANGHVLADPPVLTAITGGQAAIPGFATRPQAEFVLATLLGG